MSGFSAEEFFGMIEKHKITTTFLVPVMIYVLLDSPEAETADMSSIETLFYGASAMSPTRLAEGIRKWGPIFFQCYGQSEAPMVLSHLKKADHDLRQARAAGLVRRPSPWVRLALLDDDNKPVAPGEAGEICVRGPLVMARLPRAPRADRRGLRRRLDAHRRRRPLRRRRVSSTSSIARRT